MRRTLWQKVEEAKRKGIEREQFEKIESLEAAIAYHQNKINENEEAIKDIEKAAKSKLERIEV